MIFLADNLTLNNYKLNITTMNEKIEKKEWITPEIVDLDVEKTAGGASSTYTEGTWPGGGVS